jgi:hypothetical protein
MGFRSSYGLSMKKPGHVFPVKPGDKTFNASLEHIIEGLR